MILAALQTLGPFTPQYIAGDTGQTLYLAAAGRECPSRLKTRLPRRPHAAQITAIYARLNTLPHLASTDKTLLHGCAVESNSFTGENVNTTAKKA